MPFDSSQPYGIIETLAPKFKYISQGGNIYDFDPPNALVASLPTYTAPVASIDNSVYRGSWSGRPAASSVSVGTQITITDLGVGGRSWFWSDGTYWRPINGRVLLAAQTTPMIQLSSCTLDATGGFSLVTALGVQPTGNTSVYLTASSGLTAGWYTATWSSTSAGQITGNPATTAGAYAGTTSEITAFTLTIPGGLLGIGGEIEVSPYMAGASNGTANNKNHNFYYGSFNFWSKNMTNTGPWGMYRASVRNGGVTGKQIGQRTNVVWADSTSGPSIGAIVSTSDQTFAVKLQTPTSAADIAYIWGFDVWLNH